MFGIKGIQAELQKEMNKNIAGIVNQKINWLMFEPYKNMRTVFQVRRMKANLAAGVLQKDILAEF